ncbi:MAG: hypothetical protein AB7S70_04545 [Hyphomicrobium sp.]|uniref:hypothetical protein n=1 Tax=Hyphomicrobium sp. TaxID=82 RepID=UPI003D0E4F92
MQTFLILAGMLWTFAGMGVLTSAKSAIHEILACLAISFAVMFWAFAAVLHQLRATAGALTTAVQAISSSQNQHGAHANGEMRTDPGDWRPGQAAQDFINSGR